MHHIQHPHPTHSGVDMTEGNITGHLIRFALPLLAGNIFQQLYNMVDTWVVGNFVSNEAFSAVGTVGPIVNMLIGCFLGFSSGAGVVISQYYGARRTERVHDAVHTALVLTVLFESFAEPLLLMFGASENTIGYALDYMRIYALGTIFVQLTLGMNAYITAQGFATVSMKTVLIGALLNTALDPLFIFVLGLGVRGAALATVISQAVSAVWVMTFLTGKKTRWYLKRENLHVDAKIVLPCIALGLSPFVMQSTESLIAICFNSSLLRYGGDMAVGTMTVLTSIMQFSNMPLQGLTQGAQPIVSYNFGAKNAQRVRDAYFCLLRACFTYSMAIWLLVELFPRAFILIFNNDPALVEYAAWAVRIYMGCSGIFGIQIACQQTFVALGNAKTSLFLAVWRKIILLIPLIYILPHFFVDKAFAVFLAEPVADFGAVALTSFTFYRQFRRSMRELEGAEATGER